MPQRGRVGSVWEAGEQRSSMPLAELPRCTGQEPCVCEPWTGGGKQGADFHFHKRGWPQAEPPMKMLQPQPAQHRLSGNSSEGAVMTKGGLGQGSAVDWQGQAALPELPFSWNPGWGPLHPIFPDSLTCARLEGGGLSWF